MLKIEESGFPDGSDVDVRGGGAQGDSRLLAEPPELGVSMTGIGKAWGEKDISEQTQDINFGLLKLEFIIIYPRQGLSRQLETLHYF